MNAEDNVEAWLKKVTEDELSARVVLKEGAPATACFLAQQMAEKLLKAVLVKHQQELPKIHDLVALASFARTALPEVERLKEDLKTLNRYYVESRYPGDFPEFSREECTAAFEAALRVQELVRHHLRPLP